MSPQTLPAEKSFPLELVTEAERLAERREAADYEALVVDEDQARQAVASAERFLSALDQLLT